MPPQPSAQPQPQSRLLALDLGERRIGVAVSEPVTGEPRPAATVERRTDQQAVEAVAELIDRYEAKVCVVGLPLNMDGTEGPQAQRARSFAGRLRAARPEVRYEFHDERLTSFEADERMDAHGVAPKRRKELRDRIAAVVILEGYLEKRKESEAS